MKLRMKTLGHYVVLGIIFASILSGGMSLFGKGKRSSHPVLCNTLTSNALSGVDVYKKKISNGVQITLKSRDAQRLSQILAVMERCQGDQQTAGKTQATCNAVPTPTPGAANNAQSCTPPQTASCKTSCQPQTSCQTQTGCQTQKSSCQKGNCTELLYTKGVSCMIKQNKKSLVVSLTSGDPEMVKLIRSVYIPRNRQMMVRRNVVSIPPMTENTGGGGGCGGGR